MALAWFAFPDPKALWPIEVTLLGISIVVKLVVFWKAVWPIEVTVLGSLTVSSLVAPLKVALLIVWIVVLDKSIVVKPELTKALSPIEVNPVGRFTLVKLVVPSKALLPIEVNPLGSLTLLKLVHPWNRLAGNCVTWVADKSMVVREVVAVLVVVWLLVVTFPNTLFPKLVKLFGTFTSVKLVQLWKALLPIVSNFVAWLKSRLVIPLLMNALSATVCSTVLLAKLMVFKPLVFSNACAPT